MNILEIDLTSIVVEGRQRETFPDDSGLKASIAKFGIINPLTVEPYNGTEGKYRLIAGERRLRCCISLSLKSAPCVLKEELDEEGRKEIELEENLHRANLSDEETIEAIRDIHRLKVAKYGGGQGKEGWSLQDTADSVGISKSLVGLYSQIANAKDKSPAVLDALRKSGIVAAYKQLNFERTNAVTAVITRHRVAALPSVESGGFNPDQYLLQGDSRILIRAVPTGTVDLVFTDPPYGVSVEKMKFWGSFTGDIKYDDTPEAVDKMMIELLPELYRVMKDDSFIFFWQPIQLLERDTRPVIFKEMMEAAGFSIAKIPFFWCKNCQPYTPNPEQWFGTSVECGIYGYKGKPQLAARGMKNYIEHEPVKPSEKLHPHEKPMELQMMLLQRFVREGSFVLDPFAGTANVVRAGLKAKMKVLAFELDEDYYNKAKLRLIQENSK